MYCQLNTKVYKRVKEPQKVRKKGEVDDVARMMVVVNKPGCDEIKSECGVWALILVSQRYYKVSVRLHWISERIFG